MSPQLQTILDSIQNTADLSESEKESLIRKVKEADKAQSLSQFKLDRLEKDRNTLTIMLQESIEDLQKKSRAIEAQNRELEIESSLEKVRTVAMGMRKRDDMLDICRIISGQLELLGIKEIRNVQTAIFYKDKGTYINYEYYRLHDKALVTEVDYTNDEMSIEFAARMIKGADEVFVRGLEGQQVKAWLNVQKTTNVFIDTSLENARSLTYYWFSLGPVAIGMSTYDPLHEEEITLFKRFRNVFDLAYRRYLDIEKAEAQAREAQIEAALEKVRSHSLSMHKSDELESVVTIVFEKLHELGVVFDGGVGIYIFSEGSQNSIIWVASPDHFSSASCLNLPYQEDNFRNNPILLDIWTAREKGIDFYIQGYAFEEKNIYFNYLFEHNDYDHLPAHVRTWLLATESYTHSVALVKNSAIVVSSWTGQLLSENDNEVLKRFSKVFEQAYIRFLDLQKAEAQAREAQIQLAMERVRARTMAMHKSDELADVAGLLFKQVSDLGFKTWTTGFNVWSDDNNFYTDFITSPQGNLIKAYTIDATEFSAFTELSDAKKRGDEFLVQYLEGDRLKETYKRLSDFGNEKQYEKMLEDGFEFPSHQYDHFVFGSKVSLMFITNDPVPEAHDIFKRFGKVFEQTYTRFLDIQKAEAQAREAQIEAVLEKIRSQSLAMHHSDELKDVIIVMFKKLSELKVLHGTVAIQLFDYQTKDAIFWAGNNFQSEPQKVSLPYDEKIMTEDTCHRDLWDAMTKKETIFNKVYSKEQKDKWFEYVFAKNDLGRINSDTREIILRAEIHTVCFIPEKHSALFADSWDGSVYTEDDLNVLKRAAKVFEQAYVRFLDLQKAEAQAREAQIEAALERVRSRTMAMQRSEELANVATVLFQQVKALGVPQWTCGFSIFEIDDKEFTWYPGSAEGDILLPVKIPLTEHPVFISFNESRKRGDELYVYEKKGEMQADHYLYMLSLPVVGEGLQNMLDSGIQFPSFQIDHLANFSHGNLVFITYEHFPEMHDVFRRFAKVFDQTYTRFLDLQKAEAQAREAQIEAVLEKIRSQSLAMHHSDELKDVIIVMFKKLSELKVLHGTVAIQLFDYQTKDAIFWAGNNFQSEPQKVSLPYDEKIMTEDTCLRDLWDAMTTKETIFNKVYSKEQKDKLFEYVFAKNDLGRINSDTREIILRAEIHTVCFIPEKHSALFADSWDGSVYTEDDLNVLKRAAKVFEQAYVRFLDLQKAETQAREAQIETALERVRSRTLAMQKSDELAETVAILFKQLIILGITPNRLYINIVKDETGEAESWITDEDGSKISMAYLANMNANPTFKKMYDGWKTQNRSLVIDMQGKELDEYFKHLTSLNVSFKGGLSQKRRLQYLAYFSRGFIGMASPDEQPAETMQLLERFAAVFNLTFTRFNDLKIAEAHALQAEQDLIEIKAARKKAEDTLTELQATQRQLVQSEKMASLGELTAGIAHEIQNPLNFVNNFSEVSNELLDEMKTELEKGNTKDVLTIVDDVKQNLEKILHHGKRADAIVKGMLQHSRTSSSQKELTDINALADEYLRLAYHGLRAKDKSFNAKFITEFDKDVGKVNIIPQEIGRVILNLINNAFYAVNERKKLEGVGYEPTVAISTASIEPPLGGRSVQIKVADNGGGIPQKVLEKIFQPFFTTKPTGQGTGLGLSLAYDIVKVHGGEIKVETKEGVGSEFIIQLPVV